MKKKSIDFCIEYLTKMNGYEVTNTSDKFSTFRGLMNISMPYSFSEEYYQKQDEVLQEELSKKEIVDGESLEYVNNIALYQGDITQLKVDAIVNACNEKLLGCFVPLHSCIDNAIHSFAGLQVRRDLISVMKEQGGDEPNGQCKVTKGYNLPSKYIFHTVGPKVSVRPTQEDKGDLKNCYISCLNKAKEMNLKTIAFPAISTGIYGFPKGLAASIALSTVKKFLLENSMKVIFVTFSDEDYALYKIRVEQ